MNQKTSMSNQRVRSHPAPATLLLALPAAIVAQTFTAAVMFAPAVLAPAVSADIGVPATMVGVVTALIYLASAMAAPAAGARVPRVGAVRMTQLGLLLAGTGLALSVIAHPFVIIIAALMIGLGYGPSTPAGSALLAEHTPPRFLNVIMSLRQTSVPLGGALAGFAIPWLITMGGWRMAALVCAGACALIAVALQPLRAKLDHPSASASAASAGLMDALRMLVSHAELRRISLTAFLYGGVQLSFASFLVVFLVERAGLSVVRAGAVLSAAMLAGMFGRLLWAAAADYFRSARSVLIVLGLVTACCAAVMTQLSSQWPYAAILVLASVFGATTLGWNGVYIGELARVAPPGRVAMATGASLACAYFGAVIVPPLFALALALTQSYVVGFMMLAVLATAGVVSMLHRPQVQ
jgi:MFS family permease